VLRDVHCLTLPQQYVANHIHYITLHNVIILQHAHNRPSQSEKNVHKGDSYSSYSNGVSMCSNGAGGTEYATSNEGSVNGQGPKAAVDLQLQAAANSIFMRRATSETGAH
jgi:hypothetical protein